MRILTVVKHVPDSNAALKVLPDGSGIDQTSLKLVVDPFDEFGIELAVQLSEKRSDVTEIVAVTLGPDKAAEALRIALAMGAHRGIHVNDPAFESMDEIFIASIIAQAVKKESDPFDLIFCGKYNIDLDAGAVGPALAEFLDLPHIGAVQALDLSEDGKSFVAKRRIEGAEEIVECDLPALLTIEKGLVEPRYPSLPNLMKAKKKPVTVLTAGELAIEGEQSTQLLSIQEPPPKPACTLIEGEPHEIAQELVKRLREEAKVI